MTAQDDAAELIKILHLAPNYKIKIICALYGVKGDCCSQICARFKQSAERKNIIQMRRDKEARRECVQRADFCE